MFTLPELGQAGAISDSIEAMQRHWEVMHIRDEIGNEVEKRDRELSSIAMLARQDIDRYIWLSECRPDLAQSAPGPPGERLVTEIGEEKKIRKKKSVNGPKARRNSNRCSDDLVHSRGSDEFSDLLRIFSTLVLINSIPRLKF